MRVIDPDFESPAASSVPTPQEGASWRGELTLACERVDARSVLTERSHRGPLRLLRPLYPEGDAVCHAVIVHPPGGIVGGDALHTRVRTESSAHLLVTTPGAQKWYRSNDATAIASTQISLAERSQLEWLPQESIVFDGARVNQAIHINLGERARFFGWDIVCFGRLARNERFVRGMYRQAIEITRHGSPIWTEKVVLVGNDPLFASPLGFNGMSVVANAWIGVDSEAQCAATLEIVRSVIGEHSCAGASAPDASLIVVKVVDHDCVSVRALISEVWRKIREPVFNVAPNTPRIWLT